MVEKIEKYFKIKEKGTTIKTEIIAGITTFLAMAYILAVNPGILGSTGLSVSGVFLATALSAGIASVLMGVLANYPVSLAPGMGVNALFAYTICGTMGYTPAAGLAAVFVSGVLFLIISLTGLRKAIIEAIPQQLKLAIGAGIGFFIAFVGLKNAGFIVASPVTGVTLGDLTNPGVILTIIGIIITLAFVGKKVPAAVFYGLVITAILGVIFGIAGLEGNLPLVPSAIISTDIDFSLVGVFMNGIEELFSSPDCILALFALLFVDFFDTAGTLITVANRTDLVKEDGDLVDVERALAADAIGTVVGATLGTSTVTSFVESTAGVEAGGRTGLTACTTGVLFFISILFFPITQMFTYTVTAPALVVVGVLMAQQLKGIDWDDFVFAAAGFVTIISMVLTYSISNGIAFGFIVYGAMMAVLGRVKEIKPMVWGLIIVFILYFAFI